MAPPRILKRKRPNQPEEITFDFSARHDYLTGFHKRKLDRAKHAQEVTAKKEKQSKLEARRQLRAERKAELERYVKSVDELMSKAEDFWQGGSDDSDNEWTGIDQEEKPVDYEENYSDDDRNTTVVVEEVDITRQGFQRVAGAEDHQDEQAKETEQTAEKTAQKDQPSSSNKKRPWSREASKRDKQKKVKFRYETKAERKIARSKERAGGAKAKARRKGYS